MSTPKHIIIVGVNWFGDAVMSTPVFAAIKKHLPDVTISLITHSRVKELFTCFPYIDNIIAFKGKNFFAVLRLLPHLFRLKPDCAILLRPSFTKSFIMRLAGVRSIIQHSKADLADSESHRMDVYLSLLDKLDIPVSSRQPEIFLSPDEISSGKDMVKDLTDKDRKLIVLHPMANWGPKRWPPESFALLADLLNKNFNAVIVFTGTARDKKLVGQIRSLMSTSSIDTTGTMSIRQTAAFIKSAALFISADTGIMHLASALGTSIVAVFGPTAPEQTGPRGNGRQILLTGDTAGCSIPCYNENCAEFKCINTITPRRVLSAAKKILETDA